MQMTSSFFWKDAPGFIENVSRVLDSVSTC
jgi:hypothetical protein